MDRRSGLLGPSEQLGPIKTLEDLGNQMTGGQSLHSGPLGSYRVLGDKREENGARWDKTGVGGSQGSLEEARDIQRAAEGSTRQSFRQRIRQWEESGKEAKGREGHKGSRQGRSTDKR